MELTETQRKILTEFGNMQCNDASYGEEPHYLVLNDEASVVTYKYLERETGISLKELKAEVLSLRNQQIVELVTAFDREYEHRAGSGYFLTEKGRKLIEENKLHDELKEQ